MLNCKFYFPKKIKILSRYRTENIELYLMNFTNNCHLNTIMNFLLGRCIVLTTTIYNFICTYVYKELNERTGEWMSETAKQNNTSSNVWHLLLFILFSMYNRRAFTALLKLFFYLFSQIYCLYFDFDFRIISAIVIVYFMTQNAKAKARCVCIF